MDKKNKSSRKLIDLSSGNKSLTDYEINTMSYQKVFGLDKRSFCDIYCSLLKNKQLIMFTFCSFNDYNSGIIKKFTFFLSFAVHYTINGLFFTDDFMHKIYTRGGGYDTALHFPKIILSTIISIIFLRIMLETLILTDRNVLQVKIQKTKKLALKMKTEAMKCINIKFAIFFIVNFILLVLFQLSKSHFLLCQDFLCLSL